MKFQNKFKNHDLSQEENARLDNLRQRMLLMGITIIEHEDLFFGGGISTEEPDLAMFRYKEEDEELLMKMIDPQGRSKIFNLKYILLLHLLFLYVDSPRVCLHPLALSLSPNLFPYQRFLHHHESGPLQCVVI